MDSLSATSTNEDLDISFLLGLITPHKSRPYGGWHAILHCCLLMSLNKDDISASRFVEIADDRSINFDTSKYEEIFINFLKHCPYKFIINY